MVSHPEPDILECKVNWALRNTAINKASGCDEIPELLKSVLHSLCQQIWKTQQWPQDWKRSILIPIPKKDSTKECANHQTIAFISHASNVMLKILHARRQYYANQELPDVQVGFRKGRGARDQIANISWIIEEAREFQKNICVCCSYYAKAFVWVMTNWKTLRWESRPSYLSPEELVHESRSNS